MLLDEPPSTSWENWDAFIGALGEWLSNKAGVKTPMWCLDESRYLKHGWWVSPLESLKAIEYAKTPIELKYRGIYIDMDELVNV